MTATTIPRDLAERCLEFIARNGLSYDSMRLASDIRAALSAPAGPLTAEECRAFAERCRKLESEKVSLVSGAMRACYSLDMLALQLEDANAPAWTGPQPVAETTVDKGTD